MTAGDVYTYTPKQSHCTEGLAIEDERGNLIDWFWGGRGDSMIGKRVPAHATDLMKIANLNDYELTPRDGRESNKEYAERDRLTITSQHGLRRTYYVRKGAAPDLATKIENAREQLEQAESTLRSAQYKFQRAQEALTHLEAEAAA